MYVERGMYSESKEEASAIANEVRCSERNHAREEDKKVAVKWSEKNETKSSMQEQTEAKPASG
jgi:hypothetical protein